jgi:hypothetical protein
VTISISSYFVDRLNESPKIRWSQHRFGAEHQFRIAIFGTAGRRPTEHPHRHHLGNRSSYGRQTEGINREAIAVFLDRIPFRADPTFTAVLDIRIEIDFRICDRTNLGNLFSIGFSREEE